MKTLLFLLLTLPTIAQEYDTLCCYSNGRRVAILQYDALGNANGRQVFFSKHGNGQPDHIFYMRNGIAHGPDTTFFTGDDAIYSIENYEYGDKHGEFTYFDLRDGSVRRKKYFWDNREITKEQFIRRIENQDKPQYDTLKVDGKILAIWEMVDGLKHGRAVSYLDGKIIAIRYFYKDLQHGPDSLFGLKNSSLSSTGHFEYGLREGECHYFHNGKYVFTQVFRHGKPVTSASVLPRPRE